MLGMIKALIKNKWFGAIMNIVLIIVVTMIG